MSEFQEKLEHILGDPSAMEQIMAMARSLGGGSSSCAPPQSADPAPPCAQPPGNAPEASGAPLLDALGQLDPEMLSGIAQLMGQYHSNDDQRVALLNALRPFVQERRYAKLDKAIQIAKLSRLIRMALEIFRAKKGGGEHV